MKFIYGMIMFPPRLLNKNLVRVIGNLPLLLWIVQEIPKVIKVLGICLRCIQEFEEKILWFTTSHSLKTSLEGIGLEQA